LKGRLKSFNESVSEATRYTFVIAYDGRYRVRLLLSEVVNVEVRILHTYRLPSSGWYLVISEIAYRWLILRL
jgi:hypothetical protein